MKKFCLVIILLLTVALQCIAQKDDNKSFNLNKLPKQDTLLSGWVFHTGDDPQWAATAYDDSKWKPMDASQDVQQFSRLHRPGIGWIRLHINVDTAVAKQQLVAYIVQYTASEVYLNGKLLHKYGTVSSDPDKVSAYLPSTRPFNIELKPQSDNVLAVRVAYQPGIPYESIFYEPLPVFKIFINNQQTAFDNYDSGQQRTSMYIIIFSIGSGVLLILSVIYFIYFIYDRSQKVNLYYSIFTFAWCINALPIEVWGVQRFGAVAPQMWIFLIEGVGVTVGMLMMLMTVYVLFDYPQRTRFKILILAGVAVTVMMYTSGGLGFLVASVWFPIICTIEGVYVCIWAIRNHKKDAGIILGGIIFFTLSTICYYFIDAETVLAQLIFYVGQFSFPIGMSFYLSLQSSYTNKKLKATLEDVQTLSAKNLAQEQEKQLFLANQNILLEHQVEERTAELNQSLNDLKSTQIQLEQKRKAVEDKNRDLEIEAALEKVRSRSLGMHKSDELDEVVAVVAGKLQELGIEMEGTVILIPNKDKKSMIMWSAMTAHMNAPPLYVPYGHPLITEIGNVWEGETDYFAKLWSFEEKDVFWRWAFENSDFKYLPDFRKNQILAGTSYALCIALGKNSGIAIPSHTGHLLSNKDADILKRFAKVFEQAYVRFLDLQKAEAQAREGQVQLALERVRARAMAMQGSDELAELVDIVFKELTRLDFGLTHCAIAIADTDSAGLTLWQANSVPDQPPISFYRKSFDHPYPKASYKEWEKRTPKWVYHLGGAEKKAMHDHYEKSEETMNVPSAVKAEMAAFDSIVLSHSFNNFGYLRTDTTKPLSEENLDIVYRFAKVFDLCYTRFNDIKQAEEQTRESQIQLALERVRARTMAMQRSDELAETVYILFQQFKELGENPDQATIGIINAEENVIEYWVTMHGEQINRVFKFSMDEPNVTRKIYEGWKAHKKSLVIDLEGKQLRDFVTYRAAMGGAPAKEGEKRRVINVAFFSRGLINVQSTETRSKASIHLLERFAAVFEGTYTRFLDLQRAEAQAKEAKIEASLERVRSKTMAMHNSKDVGETVATMFDELVNLGVEKTARCGILIIDETKHMEVWTASYNAGGQVNMLIGRIDMMIHPLLQNIHKAWQDKAATQSYELSGNDSRIYYKAINDCPEYPVQYDLEALPEKQFNSAFFFPEGAIFVFSLEPLTIETSQLFKRFAGVFGLTYRRYLDLQKAEMQAREAQIEAALERVRGRAMAMHISEDLTSTASTVFTELKKLGIRPIRCGVGLIDKETYDTALYAATGAEGEENLELMGRVMVSGHPVLAGVYEHWVKNEDYFPVLQGESMKAYYEQLHLGFTVPDWQGGEKMHGHFIPFSEGCLYAWTEEPLDKQYVKILKRFTAVIDLTFKRYMELQRSEANARDAIREASLDRVRAEIASMRTPKDLERITPLMCEELTTLGIPFIRSGVFIVDEQQEKIHTYLSTPDGTALAAFDLHFDSEGISQDVLPAWRNKQIATIHWDEAQFATYTKNLVKQGAINANERYVTEHPDTSLDLHFIPFLQGMLYVGNVAPLTESEINLVKSLATAFSTAYARYEDFNKLEAAKGQVDKTLIELKAAQTKLIQSEKMASLGELTAGIAHEIQNPLNFVNNFSEVSVELIDEMGEELDKGDIQEAHAIAEDIKQNLEKIRHHGKRADSIVKGMLEHSRVGTGVRQPTDLNVLADEFLKLSYHGLRAKDKSFNAEMITNFDAKLPKASVVQQDIGRVLINLFNNAFYAVNQKSKAGKANYKPAVSVTTSAEKGNVIIKVKDNGNGIPDAIKDKIMQPFFTTKPTGEGTGLGLSLSYDIVVKGHGGSINVETKEGEFTEFGIHLPLKS